MPRTYFENYKRVELHPVVQRDKVFFIGIIPAKDFLDSYTVEPTEYDVEKEKGIRNAFPDLSDYLDNIVKERQHNLTVNNWLYRLGFQRRFDKKRVQEISKFLIKQEYPFFPNSIIATCDLINTVLGVEGKFSEITALHNGQDGNLSFLEKTDGNYFLYYPRNKKSILVIDGQHRLEGLKKAYADAPLLMHESRYDLIVSFILDFDRSVIAKLFYTINYTQKSVNKSLLYHLTGEFSKDLNEMVFLHELVKSLNEKQNSPFEGRIKMLGRTPEPDGELETDALRQKMTISQASIIDFMIPYVTERRENSTLQPIFIYYYKAKKIDLVDTFLTNYFEAIRDILPVWDAPQESIISKTAGVGALLSLMNFVYIKLAVDAGLDKAVPSLRGLSRSDLLDALSGLRNVDLTDFAGESSLGTLNKIKNRLLAATFSTDENTIASFQSSFKTNYSKKFSEWLAQNL